jgi:hypothetical protein
MTPPHDEEDPRLLLDRLKAGQAVTKKEIDRVAEQLDSQAPRVDRYTLLHVVGRSGRIEYRPVVERFLNSPRDPMLARLALVILCDWWGLYSDYSQRVLDFVQSVDWDLDQEVRQVAISLLGEHIRKGGDPTPSRLLLKVAEDPVEWDVIRGNAVAALARALGREYQDMPPATRVEPVDSLWSTEVLAAAKQRLCG